ncbi:MAG: response regulator [Planctomycetes bacterium]|nr:response regulator [Planctomycetota bacterium]
MPEKRKKMTPGGILVVDDDESVRETISRILQSKGFETSTANGPREGLAVAERIKPDLVLTDIKMPEMDGVEFARAIKQGHPDTPVIMMTAHACVETAIQSLKLGVDDYIQKPINWNQAVASIQSALDKRFLTLQNRKYVAELERQLVGCDRHDQAQFLKTVRGLFDAEEHARGAMLDTVESLAMAIGAKNATAKDHSKRVGAYVAKMAEALSFSEEEVRKLQLAGLLHDIGTIGIPDGILRKPVGQMTFDELAAYQEHPVTSFRILQPIREFQPILGAVRHHHERFDGAGYPDGLSGGRIPMGARMIAVADVFTGLNVDDIYGDSVNEEFAVERLMAERGTCLDPKMVDAFIEIFQGVAV